MNKKIKQYSALAVAAAAVLPMACKKDNATDDPNITVRSLNITLTDSDPTKRLSSTQQTNAEYSLIDLDGNGTIDMYAYQYYFKNGDTLSTTTIFAGVDTTDTEYLSYFSKSSLEPARFINSYFYDDTIPAISPMLITETMNNATPNYVYGYLNFFSKIGNNVLGNFTPFQGQGDKYIGIKFKINNDFHFGWMKLNISADGKTTTIREVGFDTRPNTPITIGSH